MRATLKRDDHDGMFFHVYDSTGLLFSLHEDTLIEQLECADSMARGESMDVCWTIRHRVEQEWLEGNDEQRA